MNLVIENSIYITALNKLQINPIPSKKESIFNLLQQYQKEWRFKKEIKLILMALEIFPYFDYLHERLEWHSRDLFHPDPTKSKVQPRKLLSTERNTDFIPHLSTVQTLCFVTGCDQKYFHLAVQLLESIKATKHYNNVAIGIFDLGMTQDQCDFLKQKFDAIIRNSKKIIDFSLIQEPDLSNITQIANKSRGNMSRIFPGFEYYYWMDCDTWIQDENALDKMVFYAEKQGMSGSIMLKNKTWKPGYDELPFYKGSVSKENFNQYFLGNKVMHDDMFCVHKTLAEHMATYQYNGYEQNAIVRTIIFIHYVFYKYVKNPYVIDDPSHHFGEIASCGAWLNNDILYSRYNKPIGIVCLMGQNKHLPYHMLFPKDYSQQTHNAISVVRELEKFDTALAEEIAHQYCLKYGWQHGSYQFRTFL